MKLVCIGGASDGREVEVGEKRMDVVRVLHPRQPAAVSTEHVMEIRWDCYQWRALRFHGAGEYEFLAAEGLTELDVFRKLLGRYKLPTDEAGDLGRAIEWLSTFRNSGTDEMLKAYGVFRILMFEAQECDRLKKQLAKVEAERDRLLAVVKATHAWLASEDDGPAYPEGTTRDSPGGEEIWREWWGANTEACRRATKACRELIEDMTK